LAKYFRPKVIATPVLAGLMVLAVLLIAWVLTSRVVHRQPYYNEKLAAAQAMQRWMQVIRNHRLQGGRLIDPINDPNETAIIGDKYSVITTDVGDLDAKLCTTNPNFAALMVAMLKSAGADSGDWIAVALTGSMPGANIALLCAAQTLHLHPVVITSVGASM